MQKLWSKEYSRMVEEKENQCSLYRVRFCAQQGFSSLVQALLRAVQLRLKPAKEKVACFPIKAAHLSFQNSGSTRQTGSFPKP